MGGTIPQPGGSELFEKLADMSQSVSQPEANKQDSPGFLLQASD